MGCRRLHFTGVASRLFSSNGRMGIGCGHSAGPPGLNRGRAGRLRVLASLLALVVFAALFVDSYAMSRLKPILALVPRPRPTESRPEHILAVPPRPTDPCAPVPA